MTQIEYEVNRPERVLLSVESKLAHLAGIEGALMESVGAVYEATDMWFNSEGEGSWPHLAPATVFKKSRGNRIRSVVADPERMLYESGALHASVTSSSGPYSILIPMFDGVIIGAIWTPIRALSEGTSTSGAFHTTRIPARPIFPPADSATGLALMREIGHILLKGRRSAGGIQVSSADSVGGRPWSLAPAYPGANVGRSTIGTFLPQHGFY